MTADIFDEIVEMFSEYSGELEQLEHIFNTLDGICPDCNSKIRKVDYGWGWACGCSLIGSFDRSDYAMKYLRKHDRE